MQSPASCQNPDLDSELIGLCIQVLEKLDYLWISLTVSNQITYLSKTNIYQFRMDMSSRESCIMSESSSGFWIDQTLDPFWKSWIFSESAWPFWTKLHIQVKLMDIYQFRMDISRAQACIMSESWSQLRIDPTVHPSLGDVGLSRNRLDYFEPNCIFK